MKELPFTLSTLTIWLSGTRTPRPESSKGAYSGEIGQRPTCDLKCPLIMRGVIKSSLVVDSASSESVTFSTSKGTVLKYAGLKVVDARGVLLKSSMIFDKEDYTLDLQIEDFQAVYPLTVDPMATSPAWTAESNQVSAEFGTSVSTAGDVNGDGYSDGNHSLNLSSA